MLFFKPWCSLLDVKIAGMTMSWRVTLFNRPTSETSQIALVFIVATGMRNESCNVYRPTLIYFGTLRKNEQ